MSLSVLLQFAGSALTATACVLATAAVTPAWDRLARWWVGDLIPRAETLGLDRGRVALALRLWGPVLAATPFIVGPGLGLYVLVPPSVWLAAAAPRMALRARVTVLETRFRDQLARLSSAL